MKIVDQSIVDALTGDCTRACIASLFEIELDAIPNFITFGKDWFIPFWNYIKDSGYDFYGTGFPKTRILSESPNIDGFVMASVPSRTFKNVGHSVVMDLKGLIVHDPNPNRKWQDVNVLESGDLQHWIMISKAAGIV